MPLLDDLKTDWYANRGNSKGRIITLSYRISSYIYYSRSIVVRLLGYLLVRLNNILFTWIMGIEIPPRTKIGKGLQVWHGTGLVINGNVIIGENVLLRHSTTIGNKGPDFSCPVIGNNVDIGAHSILIGGIEIGNNVTIGAGTIVTKSIPSDSIVYGYPLIIKSKLECLS